MIPKLYRSIDRGYPHRDSPLTEDGRVQAGLIRLPIKPDLIISSPMDRTIETALIILKSLKNDSPDGVQPDHIIWPDLREAHDAKCNKGSPRHAMETKCPSLDFSSCSAEWDYEPHTVGAATIRAENVRKALSELSARYKDITIVTHREFIAYLVPGASFNVSGKSKCAILELLMTCPYVSTLEIRSYRFANVEEITAKRFEKNVVTGSEQDFGPTLLVQIKGDYEASAEKSLG